MNGGLRLERGEGEAEMRYEASASRFPHGAAYNEKAFRAVEALCSGRER
jgi:hypothetical protein